MVAVDLSISGVELTNSLPFRGTEPDYKGHSYVMIVVLVTHLGIDNNKHSVIPPVVQFPIHSYLNQATNIG